MFTIDDVIEKIAQDLRGYTRHDDPIGLEEFLIGSTFTFHISITNNVEETELYYLENHGKGHTYYFPISDYKHGKILAAQLHYLFVGSIPKMDKYTGAQFDPAKQLYLFVHVMDLIPAVVPSQPNTNMIQS